MSKNMDSLNVKDEFKKLEILCRPVVEYLRENYNPYSTIIITDNQIRLTEDKLGMPMRSDAITTHCKKDGVANHEVIDSLGCKEDKHE